MNNQSATPSLLEVIQTVIDSKLADVHVCLPGKIVTYNPATQYASIKIQLTINYENGSVLQWPVLPDVPVKHPRANGGDAFIHMPLAEGDDVVLVVCERSLDNWKNQGGITDPMDRRRFNISDAYALIGGSAVPDSFTVAAPSAIEIANGSQSILQILPGGQYKIMGGSSDELITILLDFVNEVAAAMTTTALGPQLLVSTTDPSFAKIVSRLTAFIGG